MAKAAKKAPTKAVASASKLSPGTLHVNVKPNITAKALHSLLDEIFKQHGCLTCGLGGIDILIRPLEVIQPNFSKLEGIVNASLKGR